ncbi:MAG: hypothetical protein MJD61_15800 [Proteobacteria bacterium]|nr:hypothetical protein [Pseudomonadota bacterium]
MRRRFEPSLPVARAASLRYPVLVALLTQACGSGCSTTLHGDLTEENANEALLALRDRGLTASKVGESSPGGQPRFRIELPPAQMDEGLAVLAESHLPRTAQPGFSEFLRSGRLVPSSSEEQVRLLAALGGELARSLEAVDGLVRARVHIALPAARSVDFNRPSSLKEPPSQPRASVLIKHTKDALLPSDSHIQALISGAVQDLPASNVTVVRVPATSRPPAPRQWSQIGPVTVAKDSAPALKATLGLLLSLNLVLGGGLLWALRRYRVLSKA